MGMPPDDPSDTDAKSAKKTKIPSPKKPSGEPEDKSPGKEGLGIPEDDAYRMPPDDDFHHQRRKGR